TIADDVVTAAVPREGGAVGGDADHRCGLGAVPGSATGKLARARRTRIDRARAGHRRLRRVEVVRRCSARPAEEMPAMVEVVDDRRDAGGKYPLICVLGAAARHQQRAEALVEIDGDE